MTIEQFRATLAQAGRPHTLSPALRAMWEDAKGNWAAAHGLAQDIEDETGAWVHAYLHRKEGDLGNAGYWYRRAKKPAATDTLEEEWTRIVSALLRAGLTVLDDE
ncbi:MAG TPA: hypothetical protein VM115_10030 [Vicinamibacterales bacterium]|nr:hypothetical protein [Vicinamibacterales bacterium]